MMKSLMTGAAAIVLISGAAFAQKVTTETTTTRSTSEPAIVTEPIPPAVDAAVPGDFSATTSKKTTRSDGTVTERSNSYQAGADGTKAKSKYRATTRDGTEVERTKERSTSSETGQTTTTDTTRVER
jgi:hypothetical protein